MQTEHVGHGDNFIQRGIAVLRFDFRGVGQSEGDFAQGVGEQDDVRGALDFVLSRGRVAPGKVGLAGYSFGGGVALSFAAKDARVKALALISPGLSEAGWNALAEYASPKFLILGAHDNFMRFSEIQPKLEALLRLAEYQVIDSADHFWSGYERDMARVTAEFFEQGLLV